MSRNMQRPAVNSLVLSSQCSWRYPTYAMSVSGQQHKAAQIKSKNNGYVKTKGISVKKLTTALWEENKQEHHLLTPLSALHVFDRLESILISDTGSPPLCLQPLSKSCSAPMFPSCCLKPDKKYTWMWEPSLFLLCFHSSLASMSVTL